jgi:hypothetical protein
MNGTFSLKQQIANRAYFVQVALEVQEYHGRQGVTFDFAMLTKWKDAIAFGTMYFFEKHRLGAHTHVHIKVVGGEYHDPDTSSMLMFYATVQALCNAYDIPCALTIDTEGNFSVPR